MNFTKDILPFIPLSFLLGAALFSLRSFKNNFPFYLKAFSIYWVVIFLIDLTGHLLVRSGATNNHWLYNSGQIITGIFMSWFYYQILKTSTSKKRLLMFLPLLFLLILLNSIFVQPITRLQTNNFVIVGFLIAILAAVYFWHLNQSEENITLIKDPLFWINFGLLFYYAATVPFFGMLNHLYSNYPKFTGLYFKIVTYGFSIFLNLCIITGFVCRKNFQKSPSY
jgi:hypothetical protein